MRCYYHYHYGSDHDTAYDANGNVIPKNGKSSQSPPAVQQPTAAPVETNSPAQLHQQPQSEISVFVDGEKIKFDQPPENINERILVPIRYVVEQMGCTVEWDNETQTVYINEPSAPLEKTAVKTGNINVLVNNEWIDFSDQQPVNKNDRVLIPVRPVTEKLNYNVEWDSQSKFVKIDK